MHLKHNSFFKQYDDTIFIECYIHISTYILNPYYNMVLNEICMHKYSTACMLPVLKKHPKVRIGYVLSK